MEFNFEGLEMQKWNISMERAQRVDEKNGIICVVTLFTPGVMVIKMSKISIFFCIFCWWQQRISHSLDKIFKHVSKILFICFRKCYGLLGSELPLAKCQPLKIQGFGFFFFWLGSFLCFDPQYLTSGSSKAY